MTCGGCEGLGAHVRWCPESVGMIAARLGKWSERAEAFADEVGANHCEGANALYRASGILRDAALTAKATHEEGKK